MQEVKLMKATGNFYINAQATGAAATTNSNEFQRLAGKENMLKQRETFKADLRIS